MQIIAIALCLLSEAATFTPPEHWVVTQVLNGSFTLHLLTNCQGDVCDYGATPTTVELRREYELGEPITPPQGCTLSVATGDAK